MRASLPSSGAARHLLPQAGEGFRPGRYCHFLFFEALNEEFPHLSSPRRLRRHVRADDRRPLSPRRHGAVHRGREGLHHLRRRGEVRRRQSHPRRHGPEPGFARARRGRHRHHQRRHPRSLGRRQSRRRDQGRLDLFDRQGRQSRHPARRDDRDRPRHGDHRRRGQDPHRRRVRQPHSFHRAAADRRGADQRRDHDAGRRHRPGDRHARHHLHAGTVAHCADDRSGRRLRDEPRLRRQRQRQQAGGAGRAGRGGGLRAEAARGLGHHAGGDRLLPVGRRRLRCAGDDPHRHAQRVRASSRTRSRRSRAAPSTPSTPKAPAAATRPTSSRSRP